ncbi:lipopolysaccharide biosynthesis protein [Chryseobacterium caseinilyticum]|uniref:Oligosaccharide flippase family protein n=1 Tax=Chryseobacterium caseinilyticum TaxID=2771428 RepID=A0ABR8ZIH4_9FLAO|nr:oligosaccharide flippase family protein [Chryseobacterium caseinilyticum]MBD8084613.1 oligosaccharide flippase family protein [Chryseobacterium caseinilyticum]
MKSINLNEQAKSATHSVVIFTIFTFLQPIISFVLLPIYLKYLTIEQYGAYTLLITISSLISILGGLNTSSSVVPLYFRNDKKQSKSDFLNTIFSFNIIFNIFLSIIFLIIGPYIFSIFISDKNISFFPYGYLAILTGLSSQFFVICLTFEKNERKVYKYALIQMIFIFLSVCLQIVFAIYFSLEGVMWARFLSNILIFFVLLYLMRENFRFFIDKKTINTSLKYSISLIPFLLIFWVGRYADRFFLEKYVSLAEIAIYGLMMTFASLITLCSEALANSVQPFLFEYYSNPKKNEKEINNLYIFFLSIFIMFCAVLIFCVSNISFILSNSKYFDIVPYFWLAIVPSFLNGFQFLFFNILTYNLKSKLLSLIQFFSVGTQLIFIYLLVADYQVYGLITASIISNLFSLLLTVYFGTREIKIDYDFKKIVLPTSIFIMSIFIFIFTHYYYKISFSFLGSILTLEMTIVIYISAKTQINHSVKKIIKKK